MTRYALILSSALTLSALGGLGYVLCRPHSPEPTAVVAAPTADPAALAAVADARKLQDVLRALDETYPHFSDERTPQIEQQATAIKRRVAELYQQGSVLEDPAVWHELGNCYQYGEGVEKDSKQALRWYRKAVDKGYAPAMCSLGGLYVRGDGVEMDRSKGFALFSKAAEGGCADAWGELAYSYFYGWGVKPDGPKAIEYCLRSLEAGSFGNLEFFWGDRDAKMTFLEGTTPYTRAMSTLGARSARERLHAYLSTRVPQENLPEGARALLELGMQLAEQGDGEAAFLVAGCFECGYEEGEDGFAAGVDGVALLRYYHMASLLGHKGALSALAEVHECCQAIYRDDELIPVWNQFAAESGCEEAAEKLADSFRSGRKVEKNPDRAAYWYDRAGAAAEDPAYHWHSLRWILKEGKVSLPMLHFLAGRGNPEVLAYLGQRYEQGIDARTDFGLRYEGERELKTQNTRYSEKDRAPEPDLGMAIVCYRQAAEQGNAFALFRLGVLYAEGKGVAADPARAALYLQRAVEAETAPAKIFERTYEDARVKPPYAGALRYLAQCYEEGRCVERDALKAAELYYKAVERGDEQAWERLEPLLRSARFEGDLVSYRDEQESARMLAAMAARCKARPGKEAAQQALQWTMRAAALGHPESCLTLASLYEEGKEGLPKDMGKAVEWLTKAADNDSVEAEMCLAQCYEQGNGVEKDLARAVSFYRLAAEKGHAAAQLSLARSLLLGEGVDKDAAQGVEWCKKAFYQLEEDAALLLADCYEKGEGVAQNAELAKEIRALVINPQKDEE